VTALIIGIVVAVASIPLFKLWERHNLKKNRRAWREAAQRRGFTYVQDREALKVRLCHFKIFGLGHSQRVNAAMSGRMQDAEITLVDYRYVTGHGRNRRIHWQTICVLSSPSLNLPHFFVRPEVKLLDFFGKMFGGQDINFDEDPQFSKAFVLQGHDEEATRRLFDHRVRRHFARYRGRRLQIEGWQESLMVHDGKVRKPGETKDLEDLAFSFFGLWR